MKKTFLIGAISALSFIANSSAVVVVTGGTTAEFYNGPATGTVVATLIASGTISFTGLGPNFSPEGDFGGVIVSGTGTISAAETGAVTGGAIQNLGTAVVDFGADPNFGSVVIGAATDFTGLPASGAAISGAVIQINPGSTGFTWSGLTGGIEVAGAGGSFNVYLGEATVVPEPSSALLMGLGGFMLLFRRRK